MSADDAAMSTASITLRCLFLFTFAPGSEPLVGSAGAGVAVRPFYLTRDSGICVHSFRMFVHLKHKRVDKFALDMHKLARVSTIGPLEVFAP